MLGSQHLVQLIGKQADMKNPHQWRVFLWMVEPRRIELLTSSLRTTRSPS